MESISKNLWLLLTLVIPGFFTYGLWRLSLFFVTVRPNLTDATLKQIDESTLTTTCIIIAFAIMQQAIAISIEAFIYYFSNRKTSENSHQKKSTLHTLFCHRFKLSANDQLNERAERMIGNFFLSLNVSIGITILIVYFIYYIGFENSRTVLLGLTLLLPATLITTYFRMVIAKELICTIPDTRQNKNIEPQQNKNLTDQCQLILTCPFRKKKKMKKIKN